MGYGVGGKNGQDGLGMGDLRGGAHELMGGVAHELWEKEGRAVGSCYKKSESCVESVQPL